MPRITDNDLELFEQSCRRLAENYRTGAPGFSVFSRVRALDIAAEWERMAESARRERLGK